jgi:hypothetical protein
VNHRRRLISAALLTGLLLRVLALPVAVPAVDDSWRAWSYHAATDGPARMYGPHGHTVRLGDIDAPVVYPPLALDELALVGRVHLALSGGRFPNDVRLTILIKGAIALLDAVLAGLIFLVVRRAAGSRAASWAAAAYWLNPAVLMITALGYIDVCFAIPAVAAVVAASRGRAWSSGALFAAALLTKPQGIFVAPVVVLALWNSGSEAPRRRVSTALAASMIVTAVVVAPMVAAGTAWYMVRSVAVLAGHDMLSALAFNSWWIVSYLFEAAAVADQGFRAALFASPAIVTHAYAITHGLPPPRVIAAIAGSSALLWALVTARHTRDLGRHAALAAFIVDAYFTLSVQVHENHFFLIVPLLIVAAALRREFVPVLAVLSVTFALNLYLVFGVNGFGPPEWMITGTGIDSTVLIAAINCGVFAWFAVVFARSCRSAGALSVRLKPDTTP